MTTCGLLVVAAAMGPGALHAQARACAEVNVTLDRGATGLVEKRALPEREASEPFTKVAALRELENGGLLVADTREPRVAYLTPTLQDPARVLGRLGRGPGEYENPNYLTPVGRDSTVLQDVSILRWIVLFRDSIVRTLPATDFLTGALGLELSGGDRSGNLLGVKRTYQRGAAELREGDWAPAVLARLGATRVDTVATLRRRGLSLQLLQLGDGVRGYVVANPLRAGDQVRLFDDGWIAVARTDPYRVEWRAPDGVWRRGPVLEAAPRPVRNEEKRAALSLLGARFRDAPLDVLRDWPEFVPPFGERALVVAPGDHLLIKRLTLGASAPTRYDIIDRSGTRVGVLRMPNELRLAGTGRRSLYVVRTDDDGIEYVVRCAYSLR